MKQRTMNRRSFLKYCGGIAATLGLSQAMVPQIVRALTTDTRPLFVVMEERYGVHVAQIRQGFSVTTASTAEAADLGLDPGTAVMCVERRFFDERGGLLEVSRSVHPPETFHYEMTLRQVIGR